VHGNDSGESNLTDHLQTTLSYAAIFGIRDDLKLVGQQYSWLSSLFYFGWLVWAIPSNLIMQRSPPAYYLAINIFMWGALLMCQAASKNFSTIAALRVLSGAFEAIADPAFMLITSMYYTRAEQPSRISCWYAFNGVGVAAGGLIGRSGRSTLRASLRLNRVRNWPHQRGNCIVAARSSLLCLSSSAYHTLDSYEFLIVGAFCSAWAILLFFFLPNSPATFRGFTHEERLLMIARMRKNQTGVEHRQIKWDQVKETFTDYKTVSPSRLLWPMMTPHQYMFLLLGFFANIPNGGISNVGSLLILAPNLLVS